MNTELIQHITDLAAQGQRVEVSLTRRTLAVAGRTIDNDRLMKGEKHPDALAHLEALYGRYKHSVPSRADIRRPSRHFRALDEDDLDSDDVLYGADRAAALAELEAFALAAVLDGSLTWDEAVFGNGWFWQCPREKDLVLLRRWLA